MTETGLLINLRFKTIYHLGNLSIKKQQLDGDDAFVILSIRL